MNYINRDIIYIIMNDQRKRPDKLSIFINGLNKEYSNSKVLTILMK